MPRRPAPSPAPAFTLIELIVVVVILGVAASAIVPRLVKDSARSAETSAGALRDLVSAVATRSALSARPVAIDYDASRRTAEALTRKPAGRADDWSARSEWTVDPLTPPAPMTDAQIAAVTSDGVNLDPARWRIEFDPGSRRPAIGITVTQAGGPRAWRIDLASGAMRAELTPADRAGAAAPTTIDLDASGRAEEAW